MNSLKELCDSAAGFDQDLKAAKAAIVREKRSLADAKTAVSSAEEAQGILQAVAQAVQQLIHGRISAIVSKCLEAVFDDPYSFEIVFEKKRGRTEARLVFTRDGRETSQRGGGVDDVAAFALRLANLILARPPRRRVLILDEPFRNLKPIEVYGPRVRDLMFALADELGVQFIMVTHEPDLKVGHIVSLED